MDELKFLSNDVLDLLELSEDIVFNKIAKEEIKYFIEESRRIGKDKANKVLKNKFKDFNDVDKFLKDKKVDIYIKDEKLSGSVLYGRAEIEISNEKKIINLYKDSLNQLYESLNTFGITVSEEEVYRIHLTHELYHLLEYLDNEYTEKFMRNVRVLKFGPFRREVRVMKTREIAAHNFCKEFLNLKFHPKLMDYIYLIDNNLITVEELKDKISRLRGR